MGRILRPMSRMGEARRLELSGSKNSHNNVHWRRNERRLAREARVEFQLHDSQADGPLMHGDAVMRNGEAAEQRPERRAKSKLWERLVKRDKVAAAVRNERAVKRSIKAARKLAKLKAREPVAPVADAVVPQRSAPPAPSLWDRVKGVFRRKAVA